MNAVALLKQQHRDVKKLFKEALNASSPEKCQRAAEQVCDQLAVHATIEEKIFYPEAMSDKTEDMLREAVEEHLGVKRIIADLMESEPSDPQYISKVTVLKEMIEHHVEEEESDLFPRVEKRLGQSALKEMGARMEAMASELMENKEPRQAVPGETSMAAPLPTPEEAEAAAMSSEEDDEEKPPAKPRKRAPLRAKSARREAR